MSADNSGHDSMWLTEFSNTLHYAKTSFPYQESKVGYMCIHICKCVYVCMYVSGFFLPLSTVFPPPVAVDTIYSLMNKNPHLSKAVKVGV